MLSKALQRNAKHEASLSSLIRCCPPGKMIWGWKLCGTSKRLRQNWSTRNPDTPNTWSKWQAAESEPDWSL